MKIGIGTVQFGQDYGISNVAGMTHHSEVQSILDIATRAGVRVVDTAPVYGVAEQVLGNCDIAGRAFRIVTKIPAFSGEYAGQLPASIAVDCLRLSLERLRVESVYGLLLHDANDLLGPLGNAVYSALSSLKAGGLVRKIGVSAYTPHQVDALLEMFDLDLIQIPLSIFDQRLLLGGQLDRIKSRGIEVHVRSIFLQGLLLMAVAELPEHFSGIRMHMARYLAECRRHKISALHAAIAFVNALPQTDALICGVNTGKQLIEILDAACAQVETDWMYDYAIEDEAILNPSLWPAFQ